MNVIMYDTVETKHSNTAARFFIDIAGKDAATCNLRREETPPISLAVVEAWQLEVSGMILADLKNVEIEIQCNGLICVRKRLHVVGRKRLHDGFLVVGDSIMVFAEKLVPFRVTNHNQIRVHIETKAYHFGNCTMGLMLLGQELDR